MTAGALDDVLDDVDRFERNRIKRLGLLSRQQVAERYRVTVRCIHKWVRRGRLPTPVSLPFQGKRRVWWRLSVLRRFEKKAFGGTLDSEGKPSRFRSPQVHESKNVLTMPRERRE